MIRTRIHPIDKYLGGIKENTIFMVESIPEIRSDVFIYHLIKASLVEGYDVLIPYIEGRLDKLFEILGSINLGAPEKGKLYVIDAYSTLFGMVDSRAFMTIKDPYSIEEWMSVLSEALSKLERPEKTIIAIPSLSTIIDFVQEEGVIKYFPKVKEKISEVAGIFFSLIHWPYSQELLDTLREGSDAIIYASRIERKYRVCKYFKIVKCNWADPKQYSGRYFLYEEAIPGSGITIYIPKVIITGPYNAGKSTFVRTLSKKSISVDVFNTTVALDFGIIESRGIAAHIFGTPGQKRFDPILPHLAKDTIGVILIVDSTKPETLERAKEMLKKIETHNVFVVVAANKQDLPGALPPEEIKKRLNLGEDVPVVPCVATDEKSVRRVFETLITLIIEKGMWEGNEL